MTKHALGKRVVEFLARHRGEREKTAHWLVRASIKTGATDPEQEKELEKRENPMSENLSIFSIGADRQLFVCSGRDGAVSEFCRTIQEKVGPNASVSLWPYRHAGSTFVAFDAVGEGGEVVMTIIESGRSILPSPSAIRESGFEFECEVIDGVDAFYLIDLLLNSLQLTTFSGPPVFFGPRTIAK